METEIIQKQETVPQLSNNDGDHERFAHVVVPKSAVMEAMVTGTPCTALCGKVWVPSRDPKKFPVCPTCKEILEKAGAPLPDA